MKKRLFTFLIALGVMRALACSCPGPYEFDFYKNVDKDKKLGLFVFHTYGVYIYPSGFQSVFGNVILLDNFNSFNAGVGDTLTIILGDGINCAQYPGVFKQGDSLILAMEESYLPHYGKDTFFLGGECGTHYLKLSNGQYGGLTIPEIKEKILDLLQSVQDLASPLGLEVYPNPAYETLTIKAPAGKILRVDLMDVQGRWLFRKEDFHETMELDLSGILPGLYLLRAETDLGVEVRKLIRY